jgi:hypothetical protein
VRSACDNARQPTVTHRRQRSPSTAVISGRGRRTGHPGQRPRAHPRQRRCTVRSRYQTILTQAGMAGHSLLAAMSCGGPSDLGRGRVSSSAASGRGVAPAGCRA